MITVNIIRRKQHKTNKSSLHVTLGATVLSQQNRIDKAIADFIVIPAIILVGLYVTAALIDSMLGTPNETFRVIFAGVGGVAYFVYYFRKKMSEL